MDKGKLSFKPSLLVSGKENVESKEKRKRKKENDEDRDKERF